MIAPRIRVYRGFFGLLAIAAAMHDFIVMSVQKGDPLFEMVNFWSLFTYQSNMIAGVVLILGVMLPAGVVFSRRWDAVRGASATFMVTTGVVYAAMLGGVFNPFGGGHTWADSVLHQVIPAAVIIDILLQPFSTRLGYRDALIWVGYPLAYVIYSVVRGGIVDWYPYEFVDPSVAGGYVGVVISSGVILAGVFAIGVSLVLLGRLSIRRLQPQLATM